MARIETDPNYTSPTFSRATAATDLFKKEDVQNVAAALSTHDHSTGKGVRLSASAISWPLIVPNLQKIAIVDTNVAIGQPVGGGSSIELRSNSGYVFHASGSGTFLLFNAYWDEGTQTYNRFSTANKAMQLQVAQPGVFQIATAPSGANPITWTSRVILDSSFTSFTLSPGVGFYISAGNMQFNTLGSWLTWVDSNSRIFVDNPGRTMYFDAPNSNWFWRDTNAGAAARMTLAANGDLTVGGVINFANSTNYRLSTDGQSVIITAATGGAAIIGLTTNGIYSKNLANTAYVPMLASAFTVNSTRKIKDNIVPLRDPLALVMDDRLHGVHYTDKATGRARIGFVVEDFVEALPEVVDNDPSTDEPGMFNYDAVGAVTFEALKVLVARVAALEARVA